MLRLLVQVLYSIWIDFLSETISIAPGGGFWGCCCWLVAGGGGAGGIVVVVMVVVVSVLFYFVSFPSLGFQ